MSEEEHDLLTVPTKALVDEILNRADHGAVVYMRVEEHEKETISVTRRWKGNTHTIIGLLTDCTQSALEALDGRAQEGDPPETSDEAEPP